MSAVFSIAVPDGAYLLTDGATYDREGVVRAIGRKVHVASSVPLAIATRGDKAMGTLLATHLARMADQLGVDRFVEALEVAIAGLAADPEMRAAVSGDRVVEVTIAAWSSTVGGLQRVFKTDGEGAFEINAPVAHYGGQADEVEDPSQLVRMPALGETAEQWIRSVGVDVMQTFRSHYGSSKIGGAQFYAIGGHLDLTTISADGVQVETVHVWPDVIGEKINPTADKAA